MANICKTFPHKNALYGLKAYSIFFRECSHWHFAWNMIHSYFKSLSIGELIAIRSLSSAIRHLMLFHHVLHVIKMRPKIEMVRVYTRWIIFHGAIMKHMQSIWNFSVRQLPCHARRFLSAILNGNIPVTFFVLCARENPTSIRSIFINLRPKSFRQWSKIFVSPFLSNAPVIFRRLSLASTSSRLTTFLSENRSSFRNIHRGNVWQAVPISQL